MNTRILNLANESNVLSIKYKISKFPDGQQSIQIQEELLEGSEVTIRSRLNSFKDLEIIICATQSLRELGVNKINLYVPYFIGGRSDRKFVPGSSNYIKTVIAPIINLQGYSKVTILDPHSDV